MRELVLSAQSLFIFVSYWGGCVEDTNKITNKTHYGKCIAGWSIAYEEVINVYLLPRGSKVYKPKINSHHGYKSGLK